MLVIRKQVHQISIAACGKALDVIAIFKYFVSRFLDLREIKLYIGPVSYTHLIAQKLKNNHLTNNHHNIKNT